MRDLLVRRTLLVILLLFAPAALAQHPSRERGFKPENVYQFGDFDSINLFNGNLIATIPLSNEYPVAPGLSYSFVLRYSGNVWKMFDDCPNQRTDECVTVTVPQPDNGGMGWRVSFGDLRPQMSSIEGTVLSKWEYKSPDGSGHLFYDVLHDPPCPSPGNDCDPVVTGTRYTRDGSWLRMKDSGTAKVIEFPNGQRHRFEQSPHDATDWRLTWIYNQFSSFANGNPTTNFIRFEYVANTGVDDTWKISDSHGRVHYVVFEASPLAGAEVDLVDYVELETFRGTAQDTRQTVRAELTYDTTTAVRKPCGAGGQLASATPGFLTSMSLPSGDNWLFDYNKPPSTGVCTNYSGTLITALLPTGGMIKWQYQTYTYSYYAPPSIGVSDRRVLDASGNITQRTRYTSYLGRTTVEPLACESNCEIDSSWSPDSLSEHYHVAEEGPEFGLPMNKTVGDGSAEGRYLSSETFDCTPSSGNCSGVPLRQQYLKYEMDAVVSTCNTIEYPCGRDRNRRVKATRMLDGGGRFADTVNSKFDGLGHYRRTQATGNFVTTDNRETFTDYNDDVGEYVVASNGSRSPTSYAMIPASSPWLLETWDEAKVTQGSQSVLTEACFDPDNGLLLRKRTIAGGAASNAGKDQLAVFTHNTEGFVQKEESFGGDEQGISTDTCNLNPGLIVNQQLKYGVSHTYSYGALATSQVEGIPFLRVNQEIDRGTGLVRKSTDPSGLETDYVYDSSARLIEVTPPTDVAPTKYSYTVASGSTPAAVQIDTIPTAGSGTSVRYEFDFIGRVAREKRLMPDGAWSVRETVYDQLGRRKSVSEAGSGAASSKKTSFSDYDPFGRVGKITAPDDSETTFGYTGTWKTTRTQQIATNTTGGSSVQTTEEFDHYGRLVKVTEFSNGGTGALETAYTYDAGNHLATVTQGSQLSRVFTWDGRGLLVSEKHPETSDVAATFTYDARGHMRTRSKPVATTLAYDRAERLLSVTEDGVGLVKQFEYDRANSGIDKSMGRMSLARRNNRTALGDILVTETYTWAAPGGLLSSRTTTVTKNASNFAPPSSESYEYNSLGQMRKITYPSCNTCPPRSVDSTFSRGFLTGVTGYASGISYHPNGLVSAIQHLNASGASGPLYQQTRNNDMSRPGTITVSNFCNNLQIAAQPQNTTVGSGQPPNVTVTAQNALEYDWYAIGGGSSPLQTGPNNRFEVPLTTTTTLFVRVRNGSCFVDSQPFTVTISSCPAPDVSLSAPSMVHAGETVQFTVQNAPAGAAFAWKVNGSEVSGTTNAINVTPSCSASAVSVEVKVTASCGAYSIRSVTMEVKRSKAVVSGGAIIDPGASTTIQVVLTGTPPWTYRWNDKSTDDVHTTFTVLPDGTRTATVNRTVTPPAAFDYSLSSLTDGNQCAGTLEGLASVLVRPQQPVASAQVLSSTLIRVNWTYSGSLSSVDRFEIWRDDVLRFTLNDPAARYYEDAVGAGTAHVYQVRAVKSDVATADSNRYLATAVIFEDDPIVAGQTFVRAIHVSQLRTAVNAVRVLAGLTPVTFEDSPLMQYQTLVRWRHIEDLRNALDIARQQLTLPTLNYARRPLTTVHSIDDIDIMELRGGVR